MFFLRVQCEVQHGARAAPAALVLAEPNLPYEATTTAVSDCAAHSKIQAFRWHEQVVPPISAATLLRAERAEPGWPMGWCMPRAALAVDGGQYARRRERGLET